MRMTPAEYEVLATTMLVEIENYKVGKGDPANPIVYTRALEYASLLTLATYPDATNKSSQEFVYAKQLVQRASPEKVMAEEMVYFRIAQFLGATIMICERTKYKTKTYQDILDLMVLYFRAMLTDAYEADSSRLVRSTSGLGKRKIEVNEDPDTPF